MYSFIPAVILFGTGIWLYRVEWKKKPEVRNKANIMLASYVCIIGVALALLSVLFWGET